jgi:hypothetical protein
MFKSFAMTGFAIALGLAAWLLPMQGERATAQSGPLHVLVVEYDIVPAEIDNYLKAIKELAAAAVNEPGYRQLSITVSQKDANHVLLFESWDNEEFGIGNRSAIARGLREVCALGFVELTRPGRAGNGEFRISNLFRLTYLPAHGSTNARMAPI